MEVRRIESHMLSISLLERNGLSNSATSSTVPTRSQALDYQPQLGHASGRWIPMRVSANLAAMPRWRRTAAFRAWYILR